MLSRLGPGARLAVGLLAAAAVGGLLYGARALIGLDLALAAAAGSATGLAVGALARGVLPRGPVRLAGGASAALALATAALVQYASASAADANYRAQIAVAGAVSERPPLPGPGAFVLARLGLAPGPERLRAAAELFAAGAAGAAAARWRHAQ